MAYQIEVIPALELLGAAWNYAFRADESEDRIETSRRIIEWREKVERDISPFLSADVEELFRYNAPVNFLRAAILQFQLYSPEELCDWFTVEHAAEAVKLMRVLFELGEADPFSLDPATVQSGFEKHDSLLQTSIAEEVAVVLYAVRYPEAFLRRLRMVLREFYDAFVKAELPRALEFLDRKREEHQQLLDEDAKKFLNQITLDNYSSLYADSEPVRIVLSYFANRFISLNTEHYNIIIYGFDVEQLFRSFDTARVVDQFLKALADPKRAAIMRLLKQRQWYGKELADHFSLTTATMSYHLEKLLSSRLIQVHNAEKNRILYSLNRDGIKEMLQLLRDDFL